ncbi:VENN motif pre-toxin domain-containing protein, partial [Neisseriaceae bacterium ESL0693]|nr:VENN motif pre-toxin domain-containing protein [Neisseriaceae bacterium ESL0693]
HSKINADYAAVTEQSGLFAGDGGYQVNVGGHTQLTGALITSTDKAEQEHKNQLTSGTIGFTDLNNHSNYKGEGVGIGLSGDINGGANGQTVDKNGNATNSLMSGIGYGSDKGNANSTTHSGINTSNINITDKEHQTQDIDKVHTDVSTDNYTEHAGYLSNNFDKDRVQSELDTQIDVSKEFSQNTQKAQAEINQKKDQLKAERDKGNLTEQEYNEQVGNLDKINVLIGMVAGGLSAPTNNVGGIIATTASPALAYEIGQHFKENGSEGSAEHLLAHAVLGAAVAAAGGNNALIGAASAAGAEAAAPALAHWLYGKDPSDLTANEKQTVSSIIGLAGAAVGTTTYSGANVVQASQAAQNALINNEFTLAKIKEFLRNTGMYAEVTAAAGLGANFSATLNPDGSVTLTGAPAVGFALDGEVGISGGDSRPDGGYVEICAGAGMGPVGASKCATTTISDLKNFNFPNDIQSNWKVSKNVGANININFGYQTTIHKPKPVDPYQNYYKPWNTFAPANWRF